MCPVRKTPQPLSAVSCISEIAMWSLGAGVNYRWMKKQNPSHMFSSSLPSPPITLSRADRRRCSPAFSAACAARPAVLVALDQDVGFVSGPAVAFRVCLLGCVSLLPSLSLMKRCPLEHSYSFSPCLAPDDSSMSRFVLQFCVTLGISFLRISSASFTKLMKHFWFSFWQAWMQGK